jgi:hypothetical protein
MDTVTAIVELLVGLACLVLAVAIARRPGWIRVAAAVLALAGLAATVNAVIGLAQ